MGSPAETSNTATELVPTSIKLERGKLARFRELAKQCEHRNVTQQVAHMVDTFIAEKEAELAESERDLEASAA